MPLFWLYSLLLSSVSYGSTVAKLIVPVRIAQIGANLPSNEPLIGRSTMGEPMEILYLLRLL